MPSGAPHLPARHPFRYVLPVLGDHRLWPHAEFDAKPQVIAVWLKSITLTLTLTPTLTLTITLTLTRRSLPCGSSPRRR